MEGNFWRRLPNTLVTLTHPYPLVTFRLSPCVCSVDLVKTTAFGVVPEVR